jgi:diaminohydroxyphosphoribosylaminopyrimidine deaminase / 5-amino-6-(5-phosphoribosylamino)uracil reductase
VTPAERPRVTWVFGASLDGRVAAPDGTSRWISSEEARTDAHRLRAEHDAVLVGSGTARTDDPHLGLRHGVSGRAPLRVVLDTRGEIVRTGSRVADDAAPTLVAVAAGASRQGLPPTVEVIEIPTDRDDRLDLQALLTGLADRGVRTLLLEGGPTLAGAFLAADLVDRIVGYVAPLILGAGPAAVSTPGVTTLSDGRRFRLLEARVVGADVRIEAAQETGLHSQAVPAVETTESRSEPRG